MGRKEATGLEDTRLGVVDGTELLGLRNAFLIGEMKTDGMKGLFPQD